MTCIVAIEKDGKVFMGGDSAAVADWDIQQCANSKIFEVDKFLIGYTTSFRMGQILEYYLSVRDIKDGESKTQFMVKAFIPAVRALFAEHGFSEIESNKESGGVFIVGFMGEAFTVYSDFQVQRYTDGFCAVGCGASYALGALAVLDDFDPKKTLLEALATAGKFSIGVSPPYNLISM